LSKYVWKELQFSVYLTVVLNSVLHVSLLMCAELNVVNDLDECFRLKQCCIVDVVSGWCAGAFRHHCISHV